MANLFKYTDKSISIDKRLKLMISEIRHDYNSGKIKTETEYYYRIKNMISDFCDSLTKPIFKYRPAVSTPISDEYNSMISEACNDMEYIIKDCEALEDIVSQSFADNEESRKMLASEMAGLLKKINSIGESISKNADSGTVIITESFNNLEKTGNINDENSLHVNTSDGVLTLKPDSRTTVTVDSISIDEDESNGLPGNTHSVDTVNGEMHFIGNEGLHNDINDIISASDKWYEYEIFEITDKTRKQCNSYGFEYDEGISWITNEGVLKLKLILKIKDSSVCSWITLSPYVPNVKGTRPCIIEKCEVITTSNNVYRVCEGQLFDSIMILPFESHQVSRIELTLIQDSKYLTKTGHYYYTKTDTTDMSIFQNYDYSDRFARVDGNKPSVNLLGCTYNPKTKWVSYEYNNKDIEESYVKNKLFSLPESSIDKKAGQEIIDAYRYMIGINTIELKSCSFSPNGEFVSSVFNTDKPIVSVTLESDEFIPGENQDILRYYISLNGGMNWHKIYPMHRGYSGVYKYYINNDIIENIMSHNKNEKRSKNLSVMGECKSITLKIEMERPEMKNGNYTTPIVYGYRLKLKTGGDNIEY